MARKDVGCDTDERDTLTALSSDARGAVTRDEMAQDLDPGAVTVQVINIMIWSNRAQ